MKLHVKKGDTVMVIAGEDKGKTGKVLKVYPEKNRAIVEGRKGPHPHLEPHGHGRQDADPHRPQSGREDW